MGNLENHWELFSSVASSGNFDHHRFSVLGNKVGKSWDFVLKNSTKYLCYQGSDKYEKYVIDEQGGKENGDDLETWQTKGF
jgi:hypothetical protein